MIQKTDSGTTVYVCPNCCITFNILNVYIAHLKDVIHKMQIELDLVTPRSTNG